MMNGRIASSSSSSTLSLILFLSLFIAQPIAVQSNLISSSPFTTASTTTTTTTTTTTSQFSHTLLSKRNEVPFLYSKLTLRGGAIYDSDDDDEESSDFDYSDDDEALFDLDDEDFYATAENDDFSEDNSLSRAYEAFQKTPPFTKAYMTASFAATALGYVTNKNDFPSLLQLSWKPTLTKLQLWRPITAFLNFGPLGLGYIMTCHFVWTYMATLERLNHNQPYDFWMMIVFGCASMVCGYGFLGLSPRFLGHNLSTFLVYVWSRYHEGMEVNMFELFNTRAELLPWFFLAQTFLLEGELPVLDLLGIVFGHIYHHYKTTHVLRTPKFLINWYNGDGPYSKAIREKYKKISSDFEMQ